MEKDKSIWTIGHSTRGIEEFIAMLESFDIQLLADVRNFPGSRKFPQFNKDALEGSLHRSGIGYVHFKALGGRRKPLSESENTAWRSAAFRGYADYMQTKEFTTEIESLIEIAITRRTAIMCSEAVWWRCHRSLISDYLKFHGWKVMHIMQRGSATEHPYTSAATIVNGELSYKGEDGNSG